MSDSHVKVTTNQVLRFFPFLSGLFDTAGVRGRRKIAVTVKTVAVKVDPPWHDGVSRFTAGGSITGKSFARFAGSLDSAANAPAEMVAAGSPLEDRSVKPGHYYAVLDLHEFYGIRALALYLTESDLNSACPELRNQLCLQN